MISRVRSTGPNPMIPSVPLSMGSDTRVEFPMGKSVTVYGPIVTCQMYELRNGKNLSGYYGRTVSLNASPNENPLA
jgi:hypothetical protein